eukprot:CAMPEP_0113249428 /NCGR_PEP_ID=MMETSP0008_2-20120614/11047_1 /TAXON_ID=97485 /ORGANISM="Prymnesium parvum" /LENGTH=141 /DNA_ID=CAMNT_0000097347 /DNA_START=125 /DNA_END=550 /DNA_ORIENTATION=- /assembly_acc=CAM_ASM_000153
MMSGRKQATRFVHLKHFFSPHGFLRVHGTCKETKVSREGREEHMEGRAARKGRRVERENWAEGGGPRRALPSAPSTSSPACASSESSRRGCSRGASSSRRCCTPRATTRAHPPRGLLAPAKASTGGMQVLTRREGRRAASA